jgi:uncharacterized membrane protein YciS (DUF1049 family)
MYTLRRKAIELERKNLNYGALARLTRDGGFWIVLIIRLSAIPSHFSTAVFSTCNVKFWHFFVATFLSLPKQVFLVYLGVLLVQEKQSNVVQNVMFGLVFVVSMALGVYMWFKMKKVKAVLLEEQAKRREMKLQEEMTEQDKTVAERRVAMPEESWSNPASTAYLPIAAEFPQRREWDAPPRRDWDAGPPPEQGRPF